MLLITFLSCSFFVVLSRAELRLHVGLVSFAALIYAAAIGTLETDVAQSAQQFGQVNLEAKHYWVLILYLSGTLLGTIATRVFPTNSKSGSEWVLYSESRLSFLFWIFTIISFSAALVNVMRVVTEGVSFLLAPREYEYTFGRYWYLNYAFFLHVVVFYLAVYLDRLHPGFIRKKWPLLALLVFTTPLHGIKFTVFDAVGLPIMFYISLNKRVPKAVWLIAVLLALFVVGFMTFIRGSSSGLIYGLYGYTVAAGLNHAYYLQSGIGGFSLNPSFNMYTSLQYMWKHIPWVGYVIFPIIVLAFNKWFFSGGRRTFFRVAVAAYLLYNTAFLFWGWRFFHYKQIYFLLIAGAIEIFLRFRSPGRIPSIKITDGEQL